jgi:hypothetical protein
MPVPYIGAGITVIFQLKSPVRLPSPQPHLGDFGIVRPLREGVMQVGRHRLSLFRAVQDANDA